MDTEFQLGYKKALEDLEKRFKESATDFYTKDFVNATFKDLVKEEKKRVQPVIYFTKLNKKTGDLEFDREKLYVLRSKVWWKGLQLKLLINPLILTSLLKKEVKNTIK